MNARFNAGLGAALGGAAGFLGGAATYAHRDTATQINAAIWGTFLGGIFGAVIGAPGASAIENACTARVVAAGPVTPARFP